MDQFQTSEGRAGKGRIKAEKTSDDVERKGTPEIGRGARDPDREARERREEDTLQSEGGKWDMEVPGDLIRQEDGGCRNVPGDGRTNHPHLWDRGGGSRGRGLAH